VFNFASILLLTALIATMVPQGYPAYIGAYITLGVGLSALLTYGWRDRATFVHPVSLAIVAAISLVAATLPFVYRSSQDLAAPILLLPMLCTIAMGVLAHHARWIPSPIAFASICLAAAALAATGAIYELLVLGARRPGLGNNPIHFSSLAVLVGCLAMVGAAAGTSRWRYLFLLGPVLGLVAASVSGSRGPTAAGLLMTALGLAILLTWFWRDWYFRLVIIAGSILGLAVLVYLAGTGNARILRLWESALDIFQFTGGRDDIRAALYASALQILEQSPIVGVGLGQLMIPAEAMFPDLVPDYGLENLHADWANFAGMAGSMGLLAYLLLLCAPLLLLVNRHVRQDRPVVLGACLLASGQLTLGISNATFGILPQTVLFAVSLGYFLVRARRLAADAGTPSGR